MGTPVKYEHDITGKQSSINSDEWFWWIGRKLTNWENWFSEPHQRWTDTAESRVPPNLDSESAPCPLSHSITALWLIDINEHIIQRGNTFRITDAVKDNWAKIEHWFKEKKMRISCQTTDSWVHGCYSYQGFAKNKASADQLPRFCQK